MSTAIKLTHSALTSGWTLSGQLWCQTRTDVDTAFKNDECACDNHVHDIMLIEWEHARAHSSFFIGRALISVVSMRVSNSAWTRNKTLNNWRHDSKVHFWEKKFTFQTASEYSMCRADCHAWPPIFSQANVCKTTNAIRGTITNVCAQVSLDWSYDLNGIPTMNTPKLLKTRWTLPETYQIWNRPTSFHWQKPSTTRLMIKPCELIYSYPRLPK